MKRGRLDDLAAFAVLAETRSFTRAAGRLALSPSALSHLIRAPEERLGLPLGQEAWERGKAAYEQAGRLFDPPNLRVAIPFGRADLPAGDRNASILAYLRVPNGPRPAAGWPVVLFICGLDAYHTPRIQQHLDQGCATLSLEIPGTGDCPAAPGNPAAADRLMGSVLDWVTASAVEHGFDPARIIARGISTGGYYAFRVAHTHADRLFAAVAQGGGCHHMFDPAWIGAQDQMEYPFALAEVLAYKFGYQDTDAGAAVARYAAEGRKFSLVDCGIVGLPTCKLLAINGMEDSILPIEDSFIVALQGDRKDLVARGNRAIWATPVPKISCIDGSTT